MLRIVYSSCTAEEIQGVIRDEIARAEAGDYTLEWKVYGPDGPPNLGDCLLAAGCEAEPLESVLVGGWPDQDDAPKPRAPRRVR